MRCDKTRKDDRREEMRREERRKHEIDDLCGNLAHHLR